MLNRASYLIYLSKHKNSFFKAKAIKKIQANYRWLLQKRSICVIYCHIGKVQKGNKKPHECGAVKYALEYWYLII